MAKWLKRLLSLAAIGGAVAGLVYYLKNSSSDSEDEFADDFEDEDFDLDSDLKPVSDREYVPLTPKAEEKTEADDNYIKYALNKTAASYNMYDTHMKKAKIDGCKGYSLTGVLPDGSRACITNVMAKKQDIAMQIEINYILENKDVVDDILDSFKIGKKQDKPKKKQKIQKKGEKEKPIKLGTLEGEELHYI